MARGRKPKPTVLKLIQGNPGKRPIEHGLSATIEEPDCPAGMSAEAKAIWDEIVKELMQLRVLARVDKFQLEKYCNIVARARELQNFINKNGMTYETEGKHGMMFRIRPEMAILQNAESQIKAFAAEWGMTAQSRVRIKADPRQPDMFDPTAGY